MPPSVIHKFDLAITDGAQFLPLSPGAQPLFVAVQQPGSGTIQLWARRIVDAQGRPPFAGKGRAFEVCGTGQPIAGKREYVGSVMDGQFVWHIMEIVAPSDA